MNLMDRQLIRGYLKAYLVCVVSLLSLYVVVDLFMNLDDFFVEHHHGLAAVLKRIGSYYGYKITQYYDRMCEAVVLLAAMFTVAWMQRSNELLPLLSAGVSTHRVVCPILLSASVMLLLSMANQELIIPRIGGFLLSPRDDPDGEKDLEVHSTIEPNGGVFIKGERASRRQMVVKNFSCLLPESVTRNLVFLTAKEAYYKPPEPGHRSGGWLLTGTTPAELEGPINPEVIEAIDSGKFFLHTHEATFESITRNRTWFVYASTPQLLAELGRPDSTRLASMAVLFHMRLTRPILGLLLVFMGLSIILRDQNRNVFISTALCLVVCAVFFGAGFTCKFLGDNEYLAPALAAWLPVLTFGPVAFVLFDAIHT